MEKLDESERRRLKAEARVQELEDRYGRAN
jgi:hypothetical protein